MRDLTKTYTVTRRSVFLLVVMLSSLFPYLHASEPPSSDFSLSAKPVQKFFSAGKKSGNSIRWFAQDDFGLMDFLNDIREKKIKLSSPYKLLPPGKDFLFVGIDAGMNMCQVQEVIDFAKQGNLAVLLLAPGKFSDYKRALSQKMPEGKVTNSASDRVVRIDAGKGAVILIDDPFAFCNARFKENRALWNSLLKDRKIEAVRVVQRDCYARSDRTIFVESIHNERKIEQKLETDPAFAPSFTDSNNKEEFYKMTQAYYFLSEKYYIDGKELGNWKSMMRVSSYDNFVPPDAANPEEWHFSISDPRSYPVKITDTIPAGFVKLKVQTGVTEKVPPNSITLASLSPESKLLSVMVYSVEVYDKKKENALKRELERRKASAARKAQASKEDQTPWWSLVKIPSKKKTSSTATPARPQDTEAETQRVQQEYDALKERGRLIGKGRPGQVLSDVQASVKRDKLNNWTVQLKPPESVFVVYEVAFPEIFFRREERDFKDELIPDDLSVRELCRQQRAHGINPCPVPQHEKDALKRMIGKERFPWFMQGRVSSGPYLPRRVEDALQGKDVPVKELFSSLSRYALKFSAENVILKDEFNSFHEAMLYWKAGVCRHRARLGYMILNTLGITARCVTTREHAYVEVYLPCVNNGKGGWTYLDFGGGPGAEMPDMPFEEIPAQPAGNSAAPTKVRPSVRPPSVAPVPDSSVLSIPLLVILSILFCVGFILFVLRRLRQKRHARVAMPFEGDFMASFETILANEMNDQEFASAALILLEAATPQVRDSALQQIRNWQRSIQDSMHCSERKYWKIVNFIRENQRNKTKGER